MPRQPSRSALRNALTLLAIQIVAAVGGAWWLSTTFWLGRRVVVLHAVLVGGLALITLGLQSMLVGLASPRRPAALLVAGVLPTLLFSALLFLYLGHAVAQTLWGRNLTYQVLAAGVQGLASGNLDASLGSLFPLLGALAGIAVLTFCHRKLTGSGFRGREDAGLPSPRSARAAVAFGLALVVVTAGGIASSRRMPQHYKLLRYEALTSFWLWPLLGDTHPSAALADIATAPGQPRRPNVVVFVIDAARADRFSAYGNSHSTTPTMDRMLGEGRLRRVETALATCPETVCGVTSLMSSRYMEAEPGPRIYDVLREHGYRLFFLLSGDHNWYGMKEAYSQFPDLLFDGSSATGRSVNDDEVLFEGLSHVPEAADRPAFFYFHLMSTHELGVADPRFNVYQPSSFRWGRLERSAADRATGYNHYDNSLMQADSVIGRLLESLDAKGYGRDSIVFIVGDHGQAMGEHGTDWKSYGHIYHLYEEQIRIPLLIRDDPGVAYRNLSFATQLDVAPTILARLGIEAPAMWEGRSLLEPDGDRYSFHRTTSGAHTLAVVHHSEAELYKYLRLPDGGEELYEIRSDPGEARNLMDSAPAAVVADLREHLDAKVGACPDCLDW